MKLELKHIQGYPMGKNGLKIQLPKHQLKYGKTDILPLNGVSVGGQEELVMELLLPDNDLYFSYSFEINKCKLLLHPLSKLTKEIEVNGERFIPIEKMKNSFGGHDLEVCHNSVNLVIHGARKIAINEFPLMLNELLFEWHFDIFELIKSGLAIDINTI